MRPTSLTRRIFAKTRAPRVRPPENLIKMHDSLEARSQLAAEKCVSLTDRLAMSLHAVSVRRGGTWALREISWRLRPGEPWALLGDNGAAKTHLANLLTGDVWPTPGGAAPP